MRKPRFLTTLLALVIAGTAVVDSFCIYDVYGREVKGAAAAAAEQKSENDKENDALNKERDEQQGKLLQLAAEGNVSFSPTQLDYSDTEAENTVLDSRQALSFLQRIGDRFGIENAEEEYSVEAETDYGNSHFYFLQQKFKDIPVFGSTITMETDKQGNVLDVEGSHVAIDPDTSTDPKILVDEARKIADSYIQNDLGYSEGTYNLASGGLVFDTKPGRESVILSYLYYATELGGVFISKLTIDANSGEVTGFRPMIEEEMVTLDTTLIPQGQSSKPSSMRVNRLSDESYELRDDDNLVTVYLADPDNYEQKRADLDLLSPYTYDPGKMVYNADEKYPDPSAVDALVNVGKANSFFKSVFLRNGIKNDGTALPVYVGLMGYEGSSWQNNAAIFGGSYMIVGMGTQNEDGSFKDPADSAYVDIMAHEFTHAVLDNDSRISNATYDERECQKYETSVQSAIHEGYADIFGEFAEDYSKNGKLDNDCDWKNISRDFSSPTVKTCSDYTEFTTDGHDGGFLISVPVMKAATNDKNAVPTDKLAALYYYTMPKIDAKTDFKKLRTMLERRAAVGNAECYANNDENDSFFFTDGQLEALIDAYDAVGIPSGFGYHLDQGGKIVVYDKDNNPCDDYHIKVTRLYDRTDTPLIDEDVKKSSFVFPKELANGIYKVTVTDSEDKSLEYSFEFVINDQTDDNKADKYEKEIKLFTMFGAKSREVVLVLDVSGSMNGDPMTQTKLSAQKFVNTVLEAAPATKISVVTYSSSASTLIESSSKKGSLVSTVNGLYAGGGTNIYDGLEKANDILEKSQAPKKLIVLMSDGYPNEGKYENGSYAQPCIDYAQTIKDKDITIYSLGFFHEMSESEKAECQALMSAIATPGYYFEVSSAEDAQFVMGGDNELDNVFGDLAGQVSGEKYIYIRIACPVDVLVKYGGEILSSAEKTLNTRTEFGTLTFDTEKEEEKEDDGGSDDDDEEGSGKKSSKGDGEVKILRLKDGADYEICINGTGKGKMDYTISYPNDEGEYEDVRKFKSVPITKDTLISTNTAKAEETELSVDSDGDGVFDMIYKAKEDSKAVLENSKFKLIAIIAISAILLVLIAAEILLIVKRYKSNQVCHRCGAKLANAKKFCNKCGAKAVKTRLIFPDDGRPKQKKGVIITKLVLIAIFAGSAAGVIYLYRSPATTVYKQLTNGKPSSAQRVYENAKIEDSAIQEKYLTSAVNRYIDKASDARENGKYTEEEFATLLDGAVSLDIDDITDKAEEYLGSEKESKDKSDSSSQADESSSDADESED